MEGCPRPRTLPPPCLLAPRRPRAAPAPPRAPSYRARTLPFPSPRAVPQFGPHVLPGRSSRHRGLRYHQPRTPLATADARRRPGSRVATSSPHLLAPSPRADAQDSFSGAKSWVRELQRRGDPNVVIALAGNKADLEDRRRVDREVRRLPTSCRGPAAAGTVAAAPGIPAATSLPCCSPSARPPLPRQEADEYAKENGIIHMETSAKTASNVKELFLAIGTRAGPPRGRQPLPHPAPQPPSCPRTRPPQTIPMPPSPSSSRPPRRRRKRAAAECHPHATASLFPV